MIHDQKYKLCLLLLVFLIFGGIINNEVNAEGIGGYLFVVEGRANSFGYGLSIIKAGVIFPYLWIGIGSGLIDSNVSWKHDNWAGGFLPVDIYLIPFAKSRGSYFDKFYLKASFIPSIEGGGHPNLLKQEGGIYDIGIGYKIGKGGIPLSFGIGYFYTFYYYHSAKKYDYKFYIGLSLGFFGFLFKGDLDIRERYTLSPFLRDIF